MLRGHVYTPDKTRIYENSLALAARLAMRGRTLLEGPLTVVVYAFRSIPPTRRPDADDHLKILDALNGICWKDDAQIVDARIIKVQAENFPLLRIEIDRV